MADFSADMLDLARAKRSARRQNLRRGLVGAAQAFLGGYTPEQKPQPDFTDYNKNLADAHKALVEADKGGMKPEEVLKSRVAFVRELLSDATSRLNQKSDAYTSAERERYKLQLQQINNTIDNIDRIVDRSPEGGAAEAEAVDPNAVARAITKTLAERPEDVASLPAKFQADMARMSREDRNAVGQTVAVLVNDPEFGADLAGSMKVANEKLSSQGAVDAMNQMIGNVNRIEDMQRGGLSPDQIAEQTGQPTSLVNETLRLMTQPKTAPMYPSGTEVPYGEGRELTSGTEEALALYSTPEGLDTLNVELSNALRGLTGSGGGKFAGEIAQQLQALGYSSVDDAFTQLGLVPGDPAAEARSEALRRERAPLLDQMVRPDALQPGYQSKVRDVLARPDLKQNLAKMGFSDPARGFKQAEKQASTALRAQNLADRAGQAPSGAPIVDKLNARKRKLLDRVSPGLRQAAERDYGGGS